MMEIAPFIAPWTIDWLSSMSQTYQFYEVDPNTWRDKRRISTMLSCNVKRDLTTETLESASFSTTESYNECYIRVYLIAVQNGFTHKECLGTFLVQTPSTSFNGKVKSLNLDAYSPLLELKDQKPDLGFAILKSSNVMDAVYEQTRNHMRAPVIKPTNETILPNNYIADPDESWLAYLTSLMGSANYYYMLDDMSRVLFHPVQDIDSLKPVWTFTDDNSSILYPDITDEYDLYGIPNVVEVVYSGSDSTYLYSKIVNDDESSPTSTISRGREVHYRETNPTLTGIPDQAYLDRYALELLKKFNEVQHTLTYSHGYCGNRIGDCVRLNYKKAGISNVRAKVISQNIECNEGCTVSETSIYTTNLWKE